MWICCPFIPIRQDKSGHSQFSRQLGVLDLKLLVARPQFPRLVALVTNTVKEKKARRITPATTFTNLHPCCLKSQPYIMVYREKPSRACLECRAKRRKCDLSRPACRQCIRAGSRCEKY
ncbi:hypothetical protein BDV12DRAFT_164914 [Aspergillus spectabilis]